MMLNAIAGQLKFSSCGPHLILLQVDYPSRLWHALWRRLWVLHGL